MADTGETWESKRTGICHTCVKIIKIYGTNEYVAPWHCKCNVESEILVKQQNQTTLTKGFGMKITEKHDLIRRRYRYHRPDFWDCSVD